jgi:serine/threonine-protein kinase
MAPADGKPAVRTVGRYALQHEIASGGMASVYLGKLRGPVGFSPIVAIKRPHPQFAKDPEFVRMFLDEARLAGRIRHPNIVPVIDVIAEGEELALVLEYVRGESLGKLVGEACRAGEPVPTAIASAVLCDVLRGLHAAHDAKGEHGEPLGIVHRDVSPQNLLVGTDGVARILDFGVAKAAGRVTTTREGQIKGKIAYMAPEQLRGESVDRRADVYSAAVVLWETLTGARLFRGENEGHTVERVLFGTTPPPSALRSELSDALDAVVLRGLSRERADRFGTAKEMALALSAASPPASAPEVGEWVEARAIDALEHRAKLVEEVEASVSSAAPVATTSSAGAPRESRRPARRTTLLILGAAAAAIALAGLGVFRHEASKAVDPVSSAAPPPPPPSAAAASAAAEPAVSSPTAAASPPPADSVSPPPRASAIAQGRGRAPAPPSPARAGKRGATSGATAACQRRSASGDIEFDLDCLRARQTTP